MQSKVKIFMKENKKKQSSTTQKKQPFFSEDKSKTLSQAQQNALNDLTKAQEKLTASSSLETRSFQTHALHLAKRLISPGIEGIQIVLSALGSMAVTLTNRAAETLIKEKDPDCMNLANNSSTEQSRLLIQKSAEAAGLGKASDKPETSLSEQPNPTYPGNNWSNFVYSLLNQPKSASEIEVYTPINFGKKQEGTGNGEENNNE